MATTWKGILFKENVFEKLRSISLDAVHYIVHTDKYTDSEKVAMLHGIFLYLNDVEDSMADDGSEEAPANDANS